jgi:hypothetical protein
MTYDYELRLKPWRELTLLCDFISPRGLHFGKRIVTPHHFKWLSSHPLYAMYTGFMGFLVYFNTEGKQLSGKQNDSFVSLLNTFHPTDKEVVDQSIFNKPTPNPGDNSEDHY